MPRVPIALALALVPTVGAVSVTAAPAPRAEITPSTVEAAAAPTPVRARWRWPVGPGHDVARPFERPPTPYAAGHRGIDVLSTAGAPVTAVEAGVVTHAGRIAGRGTVTVTHADGLASTYEPVAAAARRGDQVRGGGRLGTLEATGGHCGAAPCLHLGARRGQDYVDPLPLLTGGPIVLLPVSP